MNYLKILYLFSVVFCNSTVAITPKESCALEKQNVDKWQHMLNKSAKGEYQEYLHKRYQKAKVEYLQCRRRGKQDTQEQGLVGSFQAQKSVGKCQFSQAAN